MSKIIPIKLMKFWAERFSGVVFVIVGFNNRQTKMRHGPVGLPNFDDAKLELMDLDYMWR